MEDFQPGLSFSLVNRAEISARTSYVLLRKQRFRLHDKKFQPVMHFYPGFDYPDEIFIPVDRTENRHVTAGRNSARAEVYTRARVLPTSSHL